MVYVEQGALGPFEHHRLAPVAHCMQDARNIANQWFQLLTLGQGLIQHLMIIHRWLLEIMLQGEVMIFHDLLQTLGEMIRIQQFAEADTTA